MSEERDYTEDEILDEAPTDESLQNAIIDQLQFGSSEIDFDAARIYTYDQAGVMTYDKGFVIRFPDGTEFQVTIVQSR